MLYVVLLGGILLGTRAGWARKIKVAARSNMTMSYENVIKIARGAGRTWGGGVKIFWE
jgi:hypothetical protein